MATYLVRRTLLIVPTLMPVSVFIEGEGAA